MKIGWMQVRWRARLFGEQRAQFASGSGDTQSFDKLMKRMKRVDAGKHFCRDEMNQRSSSS